VTRQGTLFIPLGVNAHDKGIVEHRSGDTGLVVALDEDKRGGIPAGGIDLDQGFGGDTPGQDLAIRQSHAQHTGGVGAHAEMDHAPGLALIALDRADLAIAEAGAVDAALFEKFKFCAQVAEKFALVEHADEKKTVVVGGCVPEEKIAAVKQAVGARIAFGCAIDIDLAVGVIVGHGPAAAVLKDSFQTGAGIFGKTDAARRRGVAIEAGAVIGTLGAVAVAFDEVEVLKTVIVDVAGDGAVAFEVDGAGFGEGAAAGVAIVEHLRLVVAGAGYGEKQIEIAVVVEVGEGGRVRIGSDIHSIRGSLIGETAVPVIDQQHR